MICWWHLSWILTYYDPYLLSYVCIILDLLCHIHLEYNKWTRYSESLKWFSIGFEHLNNKTHLLRAVLSKSICSVKKHPILDQSGRDTLCICLTKWFNKLIWFIELIGSSTSLPTLGGAVILYSWLVIPLPNWQRIGEHYSAWRSRSP